MNYSIVDLVSAASAFGQLLIVILLVYVYSCLKKYSLTHQTNGLVALYLHILIAAAHYVARSALIVIIGLFAESYIFLMAASLWQLVTVGHALIVAALTIVTFIGYEEKSHHGGNP